MTGWCRTASSEAAEAPEHHSRLNSQSSGGGSQSNLPHRVTSQNMRIGPNPPGQAGVCECPGPRNSRLISAIVASVGTLSARPLRHGAPGTRASRRMPQPDVCMKQARQRGPVVCALPPRGELLYLECSARAELAWWQQHTPSAIFSTPGGTDWTTLETGAPRLRQ